MARLMNCLDCEKVDIECSREQVRDCLAKSVCEHCNWNTYYYPYGKDESRHCSNCGAEWSVYK